jgi:hypothetical protein
MSYRRRDVGTSILRENRGVNHIAGLQQSFDACTSWYLKIRHLHPLSDRALPAEDMGRQRKDMAARVTGGVASPRARRGPPYNDLRDTSRAARGTGVGGAAAGNVQFGGEDINDRGFRAYIVFIRYEVQLSILMPIFRVYLHRCFNLLK